MVGAEAQARLQAAMEDGVLKIMSKMGISTVDSYRGAQIFEAIALGPEVIDVCFTGTPSVIGGIGWHELGEDAIARHGAGRLVDAGYYRARKRGEYHTHNDDVVKALNEMKAAHLLQRALKDGRDEMYDGFAALVNGRPPTELRDLLEFVPAGPAIPIDEVEPALEITRRFSTRRAIALISPPPHHDIYSIEDLAQLIFDLKQVNGLADVSVKLVAEDGVGTIAAGVAKALAEVVQISGANGGTGASPLMSIKHAGLPWELGLADTQQALVENHLRDRIRVRVDGGFMTGRDVVVAALLGADEYSFGTAAMVAEGCIMVRACHKDTCPTGIATQRPHLRAKFGGTPEGVAAYMLFIAEEARRLLASLGLRSLDEAIGRVECLRQRRSGDDRVDSVDLSPLLRPPADPAAPRRYVAPVD